MWRRCGAAWPNLARHVENMRKFGLPVVVALNRFTTDTAAEIRCGAAAMAALGTEAVLCTHWADGAPAPPISPAPCWRGSTAGEARFRPLYPDALPLAEKLRSIAREIYRAARCR